MYKDNILYMVSLRGFKSAFYTNKADAESLYNYCKDHFSGVSMIKTDYRRIMKNLYLSRNC